MGRSSAEPSKACRGSVDHMKIPAGFILDVGKLDYLLCPRPRDDKSKYLVQAGFTNVQPAVLESAIRAAAASGDALLDRTNKFGSFHILRAALAKPGGIGLDVKLVFLHRNDDARSTVTPLNSMDRWFSFTQESPTQPSQTHPSA